MLLASRLRVPEGTRALLLDLDGVLIDTLTVEYELLDELLAGHVPGAPRLDRGLVRSVFPHPIPEAWRRILMAVGQEPEPHVVERLSRELEEQRSRRVFPVHEGINEILGAAAALKLRTAVVSNNPTKQIEELLQRAELAPMFDAVVGNDRVDVRIKPAPDLFLAGAAALGVEPESCVAVEDSLIGARSASDAGCHVIGVATGAATFAQLSTSHDVGMAYERLSAPVVRLAPGAVTRKELGTPNEFVSHMLEHVAWRLGCGVSVAWFSDDWRWLGQEVGKAVAPLLDGPDAAAALGMIDDGSCEVYVERASDPEHAIVGSGADADWFVGLRCEQLSDGRALVDMLSGLADGAGLYVRVDVVSVEDPHHTWEAIWRGIGLALRGLSQTLIDMACGASPPSAQDRTPPPPRHGFTAGIEVLTSGTDSVSVRRTTAESVCEVELVVDQAGLRCDFETSDAVAPDGLTPLLEAFAERARLGGGVRFSARELSSSHVVAEDVGIVLGAALRVLAVERMHAHGIEGSGSSMVSRRHLHPIRVGVSFEGRKFMKLVPIGWSYSELREQVIGRTLSTGSFSEDLDDFLDGLAGGMACSIVIHWERFRDPDESWRLVFEGLGAALAGVLAPNHTRRGLTPGVKATLA